MNLRPKENAGTKAEHDGLKWGKHSRVCVAFQIDEQ